MADLLTNENLFLIILAIVWIIGAIIQDLRKREVDNIWNFSLIGFALAYRLAVVIFNGNYWFFLNGLIGFIVFLVLGNLFYYSRLFAGGDAKLVIALGAVLPLSYSWIVNLKIFGLFIISFILGGGVYVFVWSFVLMLVNWKKFGKEFVNQLKIYRYIFLISFIFVLLWIITSYFIGFEFILISLFFLFFPVLWIYARAIEESCMIKRISPKELTEGDWLYEDLYVKEGKIKKSWHGVSKEELVLIRKKYRRKILVRYGVPFTPSFLIGFLGLLLVNKIGWI